MHMSDQADSDGASKHPPMLIKCVSDMKKLALSVQAAESSREQKYKET